MSANLNKDHDEKAILDTYGNPMVTGGLATHRERFAPILLPLIYIMPIALRLYYVAIALYLACAFSAYHKVSQLKTSAPADSPTTKYYDTVAILYGVAPLVAQLIYYFRLRRSYPRLTNVYVGYGWNILVLQIIFFIIPATVIIIRGH